jgi:multimeric flavodoxin WrbA
MSRPKKVILLIGSPRGFRSASFSLGSYLLEGLKQKGLETCETSVEKLNSPGPEQESLLSYINSCDILILATPLYVDSLPAAVIKALELIKDNRIPLHQPKSPLLLGMINSGFPEALQSNTALAILRLFAKESNFRWAGGLALGGGGAIEGKSLKSAGRMARNITKSLDAAASELAEGRNISREAIDLMAKPLMPAWMLPLLGGFMWRQQAKKYGVHKRLDDRPYNN